MQAYESVLSLAESALSPLNTVGGSLWPHLTLPAVQILALALPPFSGRTAIFVPLILGNVSLTWHNLFTSNTFARAALVAQWPWYLGTVGRLLFTEPEKRYWRRDRAPQEALRMGFWQKLRWSAALYCTPRGIGWSHEVKGVPPAPRRYTRGEFLASCLRWMALCWVALDVTGVYQMRYYYRDNPDPSTMAAIGTGRDTRWLPALAHRVFDAAWATAAMIYFPAQNLYTQLAMLCVALGNAPKNWPPLFGSDLRQITTVRAVWNSFWHQVIRQTFTLWSHGVMDLLRIRHGTWLSSYFQLYFTFLFTGITHGVVSYAMSYNTRLTSSLEIRAMPWVYYFLLQAVGIHLEDFTWWCYKTVVSDPAARERQATLRRYVGWAWLAIFWTAAAEFPTMVCIRTGLSAESPLPFSLVRIVLQKMGLLPKIEVV